jgi:UDP-glucose 4-epimerase
MHIVNCKRIIYSSSAAVYGEPEYNPIDEKHSLKPINYYGYTKLVGEGLLEWYAKIYGIKFVALRYFNVVGDGGLNYIDPVPENILPIVMDVIVGKRDRITIFGDDYDTRDGTCIRDYIDVNDLIEAHILALDLDRNEFINIGTSRGVSVKEFIDAAKEASGKDFVVEVGAQRPGDPATLTASNKKAKELLDWEPKKEFRETMKDTYNAYMFRLDEKKDN